MKNHSFSKNRTESLIREAEKKEVSFCFLLISLLDLGTEQKLLNYKKLLFTSPVSLSHPAEVGKGKQPRRPSADASHRGYSGGLMTDLPHPACLCSIRSVWRWPEESYVCCFSQTALWKTTRQSCARKCKTDLLIDICHLYKVSLEKSSTAVTHDTQLRLLIAPAITVNKSVIWKWTMIVLSRLWESGCLCFMLNYTAGFPFPSHIVGTLLWKWPEECVRYKLSSFLNTKKKACMWCKHLLSIWPQLLLLKRPIMLINVVTKAFYEQW